MERDDSDDDSKLRGVLQESDATARTVTMYGRLIITDEETRYECDDVDCGGADAFFARLHADQSVVKASWNGPQADTGLPAAELELED